MQSYISVYLKLDFFHEFEIKWDGEDTKTEVFNRIQLYYWIFSLLLSNK